MRCRSVLLPAPDLPMIDTISPWPMVKLAARSTWIVTPPFTKALASPRTSRRTGFCRLSVTQTFHRLELRSPERREDRKVPHDNERCDDHEDHVARCQMHRQGVDIVDVARDPEAERLQCR